MFHIWKTISQRCVVLFLSFLPQMLMKLLHSACTHQGSNKRKRQRSPSPDRTLLPESERIAHDIDIPEEEWTERLSFENQILEFCVGYCLDHLDSESDDLPGLIRPEVRFFHAFPVCKSALMRAWVMLVQDVWEDIPADEGRALDDEDDEGSDVPLDAEILLDDGEENEVEKPTIQQIIARCLKDVKKIRSVRAVQAAMHLIAVSEYVKIRDRFERSPRCRRPAQSAGLAVARQLGKSLVYFPRQVKYHEKYLLRHHHLPPLTKNGDLHGQYTLLDNETVIHNVRAYLASQDLGTISPQNLCRHLNEVIAPTLGLTGKNTTISERTAVTWLKKLGYRCTESKKGLYMDGHERPDVIEARKQYLEKMSKFERYVDGTLSYKPRGKP